MSRAATGSRRGVRRWLPVAVAGAGLALATLGLWPGGGTWGDDGGGDPARETTAALLEGNRLARGGDGGAAVAAYTAGWPGQRGAMGGADRGAGGGATAALAYNLGTTLHRMERLPEALLWYRRAAELAPGDPWVADNLELVRVELNAPRHPAPGLAGRVAGDRVTGEGRALDLAAVALAWLAFALYLALHPLRRRLGPRWQGAAGAAWLLAAGLALALWGAGAAFAAWGPRPAVLLQPCGGTGGGPLPAGSEVWVAPTVDGEWRVTTGPPGRLCSASAVALVAP